MRKIIFMMMLCLMIAAPAWAEVMDVNILPPSPPGTPSNVTVSGITDTTATVTWTAVSTATQYSVYVNGEQYTGSNSPGVTLHGLNPFTSYDVYVVAHNNGGDSGQSSLASFSTLPPAPSAPVGLNISEVKKDSAKITWQPNQYEEYIMVYRVYVDGQPVADIEPQEGTHTANLTNLSPGDHTVSVSALNEHKEGQKSNIVKFSCSEVPGPEGLIMTNHTNDKIWMQWDNVQDAIGYSIFLDGNLIANTDQTSFEIRDLLEETEYTISVCANLLDGNRSIESSVNAKTLKTMTPPTLSEYKQDIYSAILNIMPNIKILFAVICAFAITGIAKLSFVRRVRW